MMLNLSKNIKSGRINKGFTQLELADKLHVSKQAVSKWETGRNLPDISLIKDIAYLLGISPEVLLYGKKNYNFLFIALIPMLISLILICFALIMTYQRMLYLEVRIFSLSDYESWWWIFGFMAGSIALMELSYLLVFYGYIRKEFGLSLKRSLLIGLGFHFAYTFFGYFVIWLFLTKQTFNNYSFGFYLMVFLTLIEIISTILLVFQAKKEYNYWKIPKGTSWE